MSHQPKAAWAVGFACVIAFMGIGLVDPILKPIADELGASPSQVSLLFTSYMAVMGVGMGLDADDEARPARPSSSRSPTSDGRLHQVQGAFDADPSFNAKEGRHADERENDGEPEQRQQVVDHVAQ